MDISEIKLFENDESGIITIEDYHFDIEDDMLFRYEPMKKTKTGGTLCKREPVMTKEDFLMCAKQWLGIDPKEQ